MSFQTSDFDDDDEVMSEINMTPLVDVMLVLLIIFIITVPVINHAVKLDLPKATSQPNDTKPVHVNVSIDAEGKLYWNREVISRESLSGRLEAAGQTQPQPEIHLRADSKTAYEYVAKFLAAAHQAGLNKVAFATEPEKAGH